MTYTIALLYRLAQLSDSVLKVKAFQQCILSYIEKLLFFNSNPEYYPEFFGTGHVSMASKLAVLERT